MADISKTEEKQKPKVTVADIDAMNLRSMACYLGNHSAPSAAPVDLPENIVIRQAPPEDFPRTIKVFGFSLSTTVEFAKQLYLFHEQDPKAPVLVLIATYGGSADAMQGMIGSIKLIREFVRKIYFALFRSSSLKTRRF